MKILDKVFEVLNKYPKITEYGHLVLMFVWIILLIPTVIFWSQSILWVAFMSVYAIVTQHATGYSASRGARKVKESQDNS